MIIEKKKKGNGELDTDGLERGEGVKIVMLKVVPKKKNKKEKDEEEKEKDEKEEEK